jgi:trehalose 6-phosphate synthase/phosphatase
VSRLIIVSNRLPITVRVERGLPVLEPSSGGLVTGLIRHHQSSESLWVGYPGETGGLSDETWAELERDLEAQRIAPVRIRREEFRAFYDGFANGVIWPVFHYLTGRLPLRGGGGEWDAYEEVNRKFADHVAAHYQEGDLIWIHDYQLIRVPLLLRQRLPEARIGFFLHIPFPAHEVFRTLPGRRKLLQGLLGADLIGFHTSAYLRYFAVAVTQLLGYRVDVDRVAVEGRDLKLGVFPMGIDAAHYAALGEAPESLAKADEFKGDGGVRLLASIDRLDYTKGVSRRLIAYEQLLIRHPELRGKVRMVMVAVPSRERVGAYRGFRSTVNRLVGRINGQFATPSWLPVHYLYRPLTPAQLGGLYRAADVMLVTPLRDGMNLVAKEFVATRTDGDGVLVLSEFAGAASELDGALMVNPYDVDAAAGVFHDALTMAPEERRRRMETLRRRVQDYDVHRWARDFVHALKRVKPSPRHSEAELWTPSQVATAVEKIKAAKRLILFLDYDGTLVPFALSPELAVPDPALQELLRRLAARPRTEVHLVSGRSSGFLEHWFGNLGLYLTAEHGAESKYPGEKAWVPHADLSIEWREKVRPVLADYANRTPGAFIELKRFGVAWHWRPADPEFGARQARELMVHLDQLLANSPVECIAGNRVVELKPIGVSKADVVRRSFERHGAKAAYLALGDDRTDRDLFAAMPEGGISIQVGNGPSIADLRLPNPAAARTVLTTLLNGQ